MQVPSANFPLLKFSVYSQIQADIVRNEGTRLNETLDQVFIAEGVDGQRFNQAYGQFWLWTLGAYEFTRTLTQHSKCFSDDFASRAQTFKKSIALMRMPFAKQELSGKFGSTLDAEASVSSIDQENKDLGFQVGEREIWMRKLIADFSALLDSIEPSDVLARFGEA